MAVRCPACGLQIAGQAPTHCPRCQWTPGAPVAPGVPVQGVVLVPVGTRRSPLAVWALVLALSPLLGYLLVGALTDLGGSDFGGIGALVMLGGPIAGLVMGIIVRRDPTVDARSRNLALAAIIVGTVFLGMYVVAILFLMLLIMACGAACDDACVTLPVAAAPCATGVANGAPTSAVAMQQRFAHHPDLPAFANDVFRIGAWRICIGCATALPLFLVTLGTLAVVGMAPSTAVALGVLLAAAQAMSALGWTKAKATKIGVKAALGVGLGLLVHAVLHAPWPSIARSATLAGLGLLLYASTRPRARRIAQAVQAAAAPSPTGDWLVE